MVLNTNIIFPCQLTSSSNFSGWVSWFFIFGLQVQGKPNFTQLIGILSLFCHLLGLHPPFKNLIPIRFSQLYYLHYASIIFIPPLILLIELQFNFDIVSNVSFSVPGEYFRYLPTRVVIDYVLGDTKCKGIKFELNDVLEEDFQFKFTSGFFPMYNILCEDIRILYLVFYGLQHRFSYGACNLNLQSWLRFWLFLLENHIILICNVVLLETYCDIFYFLLIFLVLSTLQCLFLSHGHTFLIYPW